MQAPLIEHKRSALLHVKSGKTNFTKGCLEIFIANFKHDARCFMGRSGNGLFLITKHPGIKIRNRNRRVPNTRFMGQWC